MGRGDASAVLVLGLATASAPSVGGCHRRPSDVIVICHNGNCAGTDPNQDDTPAALAASLALRGRDGTPPIDGIEIDFVWSRAAGACLYAHALGDDVPSAPAMQAAELVADHLRAGGVTRRAERFHVMIELKRSVEGRSTRHDAGEREVHAACVLEVFDTIRAAAADADVELDVIFESFEPDLLEALIAQPTWPGQRRGGAVEIRLAAPFSIPAPFGYSHVLDDFDTVELDVVDVHPRWTSPGEYGAFEALGLEVALWTATVNSELFDALDDVEPAYVLTNEAVLLRNWLER